jgi:hypothetical protein
MPAQKLHERSGDRAARRTARLESRETRLARLGHASYESFLGSKQWGEKRSEYWEDADTPKDCALCGTNDPPLLLHHRTYERVGEERLSDLIPACNRCHILIHELERRGDLEDLNADLSVLIDNDRAREHQKQTQPKKFNREARYRCVRVERKIAEQRKRLTPGRSDRAKRAILRHLKRYEKQLADAEAELQ